MKIAVACENYQVFQHFGRTPEFAIFETDGRRVVSMTVESTGGTGHGALAQWLKERGVGLLLCGGIGGGARQALEDAGIKLVGGVFGDVAQAVEGYLTGNLAAAPDFECHHHDREAGHSCGGHSCCR